MKKNVNTHLNTDKDMKFYRYEAHEFAQLDYDGEYISSIFLNPKLSLHTYNLHKETPKGYWIGYGHQDNGLQSHSRWVSKTAKKRYAYPSIEEAMTNYIKRTERRVKILERQLDICKISLRLAKAQNLIKNDLEFQK